MLSPPSRRTKHDYFCYHKSRGASRMRLSLRSIRGASGSYHQGSAGGRDQHAEHRNPGQDKRSAINTAALLKTLIFHEWLDRLILRPDPAPGAAPLANHHQGLVQVLWLDNYLEPSLHVAPICLRAETLAGPRGCNARLGCRGEE
jgi:hypothetical protein